MYLFARKFIIYIPNSHACVCVCARVPLCNGVMCIHRNVASNTRAMMTLPTEDPCLRRPCASRHWVPRPVREACAFKDPAAFSLEMGRRILIFPTLSWPWNDHAGSQTWAVFGCLTAPLVTRPWKYFCWCLSQTQEKPSSVLCVLGIGYLRSHYLTQL